MTESHTFSVENAASWTHLSLLQLMPLVWFVLPFTRTVTFVFTVPFSLSLQFACREDDHENHQTANN
jgi:hypothetical protein